MWIAPGSGLANNFLEQLQNISTDSTGLMLAIFAVFALVHSGLAYLRPYGMPTSNYLTTVLGNSLHMRIVPLRT